MGSEEREPVQELERFGRVLFAGGFAGLGVGALVAWTGGASGTEIVLSASGGGSLGVVVAAVIGLSRSGIFRG
ncbi:hypothetical protein [Streptomyces sp. NBC_01174]|uniref:hypothetical protein n=1 Tax=Streptomyces sp. NBC_01174 TaxID=2903758 RepID=UPI0038680C34|nr:hypothetical protein OG414_40895 [Streptomyces sp. NBC_01174]